METKKRTPEPPKANRALKIVVFSIIAVAVAALVVTVIITRRPIDVPPSSSLTEPVGLPEERYSNGPTDAKVTLVEYGDYQCPTCAHFHPIVDQLLELHPEDLRIVYHHFPLTSVHPNAFGAAVAAEAAGEAGRFWEMHDMLFANQTVWANESDPDPLFIEYAVSAGIDADWFRSAIGSDAIRSIVEADRRRAVRLGVGSTPTFFVNGRVIRRLPRDVQAFNSIIDAEIRAQ